MMHCSIYKNMPNSLEMNSFTMYISNPVKIKQN